MSWGDDDNNNSALLVALLLSSGVAGAVGPRGPAGPAGATGAAGSAGAAGAAGPPGLSLVVPRTAYVSKNGSDVTGNGSFGNPYLTISAATTDVCAPPVNVGEYLLPRAVRIIDAGNYAENVSIPTLKSVTIDLGRSVIAGKITRSLNASDGFGQDKPTIILLGDLPHEAAVQGYQIAQLGSGGVAVEVVNDPGDPMPNFNMVAKNIFFSGSQTSNIAMVGDLAFQSCRLSQITLPGHKFFSSECAIAGVLSVFQWTEDFGSVVFSSIVVVVASDASSGGLRGTYFQGGGITWTGNNMFCDDYAAASFRQAGGVLVGGRTSALSANGGGGFLNVYRTAAQSVADDDVVNTNVSGVSPNTLRDVTWGGDDQVIILRKAFYQITWSVCVATASQWAVRLNAGHIPQSVKGTATATAHDLGGTCVVGLDVGDVLGIKNLSGVAVSVVAGAGAGGNATASASLTVKEIADFA